ncbi:MAG: hypothetical protein NUW22_04845 [Acidobacteria bacterium]|nr:hypothetical protein [Acidobacteriota bacterium]
MTKSFLNFWPVRSMRALIVAPILAVAIVAANPTPLSAQVRPVIATTVQTTDTTANALIVGCAIGSTTCTGGVRAGTIRLTAGIALDGATASDHGIVLASAIPASTAMAIYQSAGTLYFNGSVVALGSSVSGTIGAISVFTASNALGDSIIAQSGGNTITVTGTTNTTVGYNLNGTSINTAGTLSNVAYENQANTFVPSQTFSAGIGVSGGSPSTHGIMIPSAVPGVLTTNLHNSSGTLTWPSGASFTTVNTGQGANELYDMDQNVLTTSSPSFVLGTWTGFGTHSFSAGGTGANLLRVVNTTSGAANFGEFEVTGGTTSLYVDAFSQGYTTATSEIAASVRILSNGVGGLTLMASDPIGDVRLYARNALALTIGAVQAAAFTGAVSASNLSGTNTGDNAANSTYTIGSATQAYDADLTTWAGVTPGTGVATALAINVGSAGAPVVLNGALGTPSSGSAANLTALPAAQLSGTITSATQDLITRTATLVAGATGAGFTVALATSTMSGDLPDANLSANVPLLNAASNAFANAVTVGTTLGVTGATTLAHVGVNATGPTNQLLTIGGSYTLPAAYALFDIPATATLTSGGNGFQAQLAGAFVTAASGTHALVSPLQIATGVADTGATITNYAAIDIVSMAAFANVTTASGLRIAAPTGAGTNYAINVTSGNTLLQAATFAGAIGSTVSVALTGTTNNLGTITTGVWNAGAVTSSGGGSFTTGAFSSTLTLSGTAANIALGSNYLSGDGGDEGISIDASGNGVISGTWKLTGNQLLGTNIMDSVGTPSCTTGCTGIAGKDYAFYIADADSGDVVTFGNTWSTAPVCVVTNVGAGAYAVWAVATTTTTLTLGSIDSSGASTGLMVICRGY